MMPNVNDPYAGRPVMLPQVTEIETEQHREAKPGRATELALRLARMSRTLLALFL